MSLARASVRFLVLTVAVAHSAHLGAFEFDDGVAIQSTRQDGTKIGLVIDRSAIQSTPKWNPAHGEPPLSVAQAYAIAVDWARREYVRYDDVDVREISLVRWERWGESDRWYYRLELEPMIDGNTLHGPGNWAAVLLDGTVIGTTVLQ